jgi:hypothetical protein
MVEDAVDGLGLDEAIAMLRNDLLQARAAGAGSEIQLPVHSMTVELKVCPANHARGRMTSTRLRVPFGGDRSTPSGTMIIGVGSRTRMTSFGSGRTPDG